jgi:uncharacterized protein YbjQ (UPF0145 family)
MSNIFSAKVKSPLASAALFTTNDVPGRTIEQTFGLVALIGEGGLRNLPQLVEACLAKATELGGNAIVGAHFGSVMGAIFLYGTAVRLSH